MKTIAAGSKVSTGYYFNINRWELTFVKPDLALPTGADSFLKLPMVAVLAAAPVLGLLMVMFLPFIGIALTVGLVAKKVTASVQHAFYGVAALVQPPMATGAAYLTGEKPTAEASAKADSKSLDALEGEIAARRNEKK
jgi:hypothetical protein